MGKKVIINNKQMAEIRREVRKRFGLICTPEQIVEICSKMDNFEGSIYDTADREYFSMALIETVMPGRPTIVDRASGDGERWAWPCYGSDRIYFDTFMGTFKLAAIEKGYKLVKSVWKDIDIGTTSNHLNAVGFKIVNASKNWTKKSDLYTITYFTKTGQFIVSDYNGGAITLPPQNTIGELVRLLEVFKFEIK